MTLAMTGTGACAEDTFTTQLYELAEPVADLEDAQEFLTGKGVAFPPGASALYQASAQIVIVRQTEEAHKAIRALLEPHLMSEEAEAEAKRRAEQGLGTPVAAMTFEGLTLKEAVAQLNAKIIPHPDAKGPAVVLGEDLPAGTLGRKVALRTDDTAVAVALAAQLADDAGVICRYQNDVTLILSPARLKDALRISRISVEFIDATAAEAVEAVNGLIGKAMERYDLKADFPYVTLADPSKGHGPPAKITLTLRDASAYEVLQYVAQLSEHSIELKNGTAVLTPLRKQEP